YGNAFSPVYREAFDPDVAVGDIAAIEALSSDVPLGVDFRPGNWENREGASLKVWSYGRPIPLSERVPVLEHMGFIVVDESTYEIEAGNRDRPHVWLHAMQLDRRPGPTVDIGEAKSRLDSCFAAVMRDEAEKEWYKAHHLVARPRWAERALEPALTAALRQPPL